MAASMALEGDIPNTVVSSGHTTSISPFTSSFPPVAANGLNLTGSASHPEQGAFSPVNCIYIPYDSVF